MAQPGTLNRHHCTGARALSPPGAQADGAATRCSNTPAKRRTNLLLQTYPTLVQLRCAGMRRLRSGAASASARRCGRAAIATAAAGPHAQSPRPRRAAPAAPHAHPPRPRPARGRRLRSLATRGCCPHARPRLRRGLPRPLPRAARRLSAHRRLQRWGPGLREGARRRRGAAAGAQGRCRRAANPRARACCRRAPEGNCGAGRSGAAPASGCAAPPPGCMVHLNRHWDCCMRCSAPMRIRRLRAKPHQLGLRAAQAPASAPHRTSHAMQQGRLVAAMHACPQGCPLQYTGRIRFMAESTACTARQCLRVASPPRPCPPKIGLPGVLLLTRGQLHDARKPPEQRRTEGAARVHRCLPRRTRSWMLAPSRGRRPARPR